MASKRRAEVAKNGSLQDHRVDVFFSHEKYVQLLQLRSMKEEEKGRTVAINQIIRDLVDKAYAEKVEKTLAHGDLD